MGSYFIQGFTLGFAAAVQPGPFQAFLLSQVFSLGWRRTLPAALAPLLSDGPIIIFVLLILNQVPVWFQNLLSIIGSGFILIMAFQAYQHWRQLTRDFHNDLAPGKLIRYNSLWRAVLINALGPGPYVFWSLVAGPILLRGWQAAPSYGLFFLMGFYIAMAASLASIIVIFGTAERSGKQFRMIVLAVSALILAGLGVYQLWSGITGLL